MNIELQDRRRGFFQIDNELVDVYLAQLGTYAFAIYCVLSRHAKRGSNSTFIGQTKIGLLVNCHKRTVIRELEVLVKSGLLQQASGKEAGKENLYILVDFPSVKGVTMRTQTPLKSGSDNAPIVTPPVAMDIAGCDNDDSLIRKNNTNNKTGKDSSPQLFDLPVEEAAPKAVPDTMWHRIIAEIDRLYELANPGIDCVWAGQSFPRLKRFVESHKTWDEATIMKCIRHRFASDNINEGDPPEVFIPDLKRYVKGPLNEFSRTKKETGNAPANTVANRNDAARAAAHSRIDRAASEAVEEDF